MHRLLQTLIGTLRRWGAIIKHRTRRAPDWLKEKSERDREFDRRFGVDTALAPISVLRIDSEHRGRAVDHLASEPHELERALDSLPDPAQWTFIDLGSGKGRAVLVASLKPFRRIVGVEFAPALHEIARKNVALFPPDARRCSAIELACGDAATYELPEEDTVLFLYNPFDAEVMRKVVSRTVASLQTHPRKLLVLYTNPLHAEPWHEAGFVVIAKDERANFLLLAPPPSLAKT